MKKLYKRKFNKDVARSVVLTKYPEYSPLGWADGRREKAERNRKKRAVEKLRLWGDILKMRIENKATFAAIGKKHGLTHHRIRQIFKFIYYGKS